MKKFLKVLLMVVCIIVPLTVAVLICSYTYKHHYSEAASIYFASVKEDTDDAKKLYDEYLKYYSKYYKHVFVKEVFHNELHIADVNVYEVIEEVDGVDTLKYYFMAQNFNYYNMTEWAYVEEDPFEFFIDDIPPVYIYLCNPNDEDDFRNISMEEFGDYIDKGVEPKEDSEGTTLETYNIQVGSFSAINIPTDPCSISFLIVDDAGDDQLETIDEAWEMERVLIDIDDYSDFNVGLNAEISESGYTKYLFGHYWWWETIVSIILVGILCYSFYIVITYEKEK